MAKRGGRRGGTKMRSSKSMKRQSYNRKRKPTRKDVQQRKRRRKFKEENSEVDAKSNNTIQEQRDRKGKKVEPEQSENKTEGDQSLATSQEIQKSLEESSAPGPATKEDNPCHKSCDKLEKAKEGPVNRKEKQQRSASESESKASVEKMNKKATKRGTRGRRRAKRRGEGTSVSKDSKSKWSDSDGNECMKQNPASKEQHHQQHQQHKQQKEDAKESKKEGNERAANNPKEAEHLPVE